MPDITKLSDEQLAGIAGVSLGNISDDELYGIAGVKQQTGEELGPIERAASKATEISQAPSVLEVATSKTINQAKNMINSGLFGIPSMISKETFAPRGLTKEEELAGSLIGGDVIGGKIINTALKGIKKAYQIPSIKQNPVIAKSVDMFKKLVNKRPKKITSAGGIKAADDKIAEGLGAIYKNKELLQYGDDAGRLPQTLEEAVSAANQTKKNLLEQYTQLRKLAGEDDLVDMAEVAQKVFESQASRASEIATPAARGYAFKEANRLANMGKISLEDAEIAIRKYNQLLDPLYGKASSLDDVSTAMVNAKAASALRESVDNAVMSATGKSYQDLKNKYGAVAEIEKTLVSKLDKLARSSKTSKVSTLDTVPILYGAFTGNTPLLASGILQKVIQGQYKLLKDPNVIIGSIFRNMDKSGTKTLIQKAIELPGKGAASTLIRKKSENK